MQFNATMKKIKLLVFDNNNQHQRFFAKGGLSNQMLIIYAKNSLSKPRPGNPIGEPNGRKASHCDYQVAPTTQFNYLEGSE